MVRVFGQLLHNISQHHPTMLQDAALKCCVPLAWPKGVQPQGPGTAERKFKDQCSDWKGWGSGWVFINNDRVTTCPKQLLALAPTNSITIFFLKVPRHKLKK